MLNGKIDINEFFCWKEILDSRWTPIGFSVHRYDNQGNQMNRRKRMEINENE